MSRASRMVHYVRRAFVFVFGTSSRLPRMDTACDFALPASGIMDQYQRRLPKLPCLKRRAFQLRIERSR
jgi:hypothetical protein